MSHTNVHRHKTNRRFKQVWCTLKFKTSVILSLCRFGALWSSKLLFFVPVQVWCTLKFKTCVVLSLCRFGALWSSKPNAFVHFYFGIVSIACRYSWRIWIWQFLLPMQLFEGSGAFFMQRVYNLKINWTLFRTRFWCQEIGVFSFWNVNMFKVVCMQDAFLPVFAVFLNMWSYGPGGGVTIFCIYIYICSYSIYIYPYIFLYIYVPYIIYVYIYIVYCMDT